MKNLREATQIDCLVGDTMLELAYKAASLAFAQTLELRDHIRAGAILNVNVTCMAEPLRGVIDEPLV